MLLLTRRIGESLMIGDDIEVRVVALKGNQVMLGVNAPKSMRVLRDELCQPRDAEKKSA